MVIITNLSFKTAPGSYRPNAKKQHQSTRVIEKIDTAKKQRSVKHLTAKKNAAVKSMKTN